MHLTPKIAYEAITDLEENLAKELVPPPTNGSGTSLSWVKSQKKIKCPPSRAYLKLWEVFSRLGVTPKKDDLCLDLGPSPRGWSWELIQQGGPGDRLRPEPPRL
jgi:hypothetical protein